MDQEPKWTEKEITKAVEAAYQKAGYGVYTIGTMAAALIEELKRKPKILVTVELKGSSASHGMDFWRSQIGQPFIDDEEETIVGVAMVDG